MGRVENTVFISYRRTNLPWALAIYQNLTAHGYDVFFDYESIASGDFEQIIVGNIRARAHFLVILTPSALERCNEPGDWLRREIETALDEKRNIVPVFLEGFDFGSPSISNFLTGKLAYLKKYNGQNVPAGFFEEAMEKLRKKFLNTALDAVLHPISTDVQRAVQQQQVAASKAQDVKEKELTAQEWFEKGLKSGNLDEKIHCYNEAIRLKPDYSEAFCNRGIARKDKGDLDGSIVDCNEAIRLKPDLVYAHNARGAAKYLKKDYDGALKDYNEAIRLKPDMADPYNNRGNVRRDKGDLDGAIQDYNEAIRLKQNYAEPFNGRGNARSDKGDKDGAIQDYTEAIRIKPEYAEPYHGRGNARGDKGDLDGAIKDYTETIRLNPNYINAYWSRGSTYYNKKDYRSAIVDYEKYFAMGGTDERVRQYLKNAKDRV